MSDLEKDLAEVVRLDRKEKKHVEAYGFHIYPEAPQCALNILQAHHAEIAQNAKDARRLRALEMAMQESNLTDYAYGRIAERADEIMREGK